MTNIDIIRNGKFQNPRAEEIRKKIIQLDCGINAKLISELNKEISNVTDEKILIEILVDFLHEMEG